MRGIAIGILTLAAASISVLPFQMPQQGPRTALAVFDASQPIPFFIQDGAGVPGYTPSDRELAVWALDAWSRESGGKLRFVQAKAAASALVRIRWISANEGLFGETQRIQVEGKQGALVFVMPDVARSAGTDELLRDTIVYLTCVHELGHAVGMPHTSKFEDIMYSFAYGGDIEAYFLRYRNALKSRADISKYSGLSLSDSAFLKQMYK